MPVTNWNTPHYVDETKASDVLANTNAIYETNQNRKANELFAKHMSPEGSLNDRAYREDATKAGLAPKYINAPLDQYALDRAAALNTATTNAQLQALGSNPMAGGRSGATVGAPEATIKYEPNPNVIPQEEPAQAPTNTFADKWSAFKSSFGQKPSGLPGTISAQPEATVQQAPNIGAAPMFGEGQTPTIQGQAPSPEANTVPITANTPQISTGQLTQPLPEGMGQSAMVPVQSTAPDTRSAQQKIEDSATNPILTTTDTKASTELDKPDIFKMNVQDDGTNQYRQFNTALNTKLGSMGLPDASTWLHQVYDQTIAQNTPAVPSKLMVLQKDGLAKYDEAKSVYNAGLIKAKGLAEKAVLDAKGTIADFAKGFGVDTVEQRKSELSPNEILMDPAKRNEAAAIKTNIQNITNLDKELAEAGTNNTKLGFLLPKAIRAYATAQNPGQQLSEGNLSEVGGSLMPERMTKEGTLDAIGKAIMRGLAGVGDKDALEMASEWISETDPAQLRSRINILHNETKVLNTVQYGNYISKRNSASVTEPPIKEPPIKEPPIKEPPIKTPEATPEVTTNKAKVEKAIGFKQKAKARSNAKPLAGMTF